MLLLASVSPLWSAGGIGRIPETDSRIAISAQLTQRSGRFHPILSFVQISYPSWRKGLKEAPAQDENQEMGKT